MPEVYEEGQTFEKLDPSLEPLQQGEYDDCRFIGCDLSSLDLSGFAFSDCAFDGCNLSTVKLNGTAFRDVRFEGCKLLGLRFYECQAFLLTVSFANCNLDLSSFYNLKIRNTRFKDSSLHDADFSGSDLTGCTFENCDLRGAIFESSVLEKCDLRTAFNYAFDPDLNRVKGAKFSREGVIGLLDKYDIEIE